MAHNTGEGTSGPVNPDTDPADSQPDDDIMERIEPLRRQFQAEAEYDLPPTAYSPGPHRDIVTGRKYEDVPMPGDDDDSDDNPATETPIAPVEDH